MISQTYLREDSYVAAATRAAAHLIKVRARHYARRPLALEALYPGLSHASPAKMIAIASHLIERESATPRRWFGFGGEINLVNAKAAYLLGRAMRRHVADETPRSVT
jgi:hypothetical protein